MKKILLLIILAFSVFSVDAQNPLVGKPSLKLVYDAAQTKKWEWTVDTNNNLTINGTGGTPSITYSDYTGTGTSLGAFSATGVLTRITNGSDGTFLSLASGVPTWVASPATSPGGSTTQVQFNNAGAFGGDSGFTTNGAGSVNIVGDLDVDNVNIDGNTISSTNSNGNIILSPNGTGDVELPLTKDLLVGGTALIRISQTGISNITGGGSISIPSATSGDIDIDPDGGNVDISEGNLELSGTTRISSAGVATFVSESLTATTNQIVTGSGGNLTTVNFPASSGGVTVTMPNQTSTVSTLALTEALSNKTITASSFSGTTIAGTTGTFTGLLQNTLTTEQVRIRYDASNYYSTTVGVNGGTNFNAVGANSNFSFSDPILAGTITTARANYNSSVTPSVQVEGASAALSSIGLTHSANNANSANIYMGKVRTTSIVQSGDGLGDLWFMGFDATGLIPAGRIRGFVDGTPGTNDMPGRIVFETTADGASSPTVAMTINSSQNVTFNGTIGLTGTRVSNSYHTNITSTNAVTVDSDRRLKKNIAKVNSGLDVVSALSAVSYNWKDPSKGEGKHYGLIAQDVQKVLPEIVGDTGENLTVAYTELIPFLIKAIQEQQAQIETLEKRISEIEK